MRRIRHTLVRHALSWASLRHALSRPLTLLVLLAVVSGPLAVAPPGARAALMPSARVALVSGYPTITVTPATTTPGGQITVSGSDFNPGEALTISIFGRPGTLAATTATSVGVLPATRVSIPTTVTPGSYFLVVSAPASRRLIETRLVISSPAAPMPTATATPPPVRVTTTMTASPTTTNRGGLVTVSGAGYLPGETIALTVSGLAGTAALTRADTGGALPPTGVGIPYSLAPGPHTITAAGTVSKRSSSVTISVEELRPAIALSAASVVPGAIVTVSGQGFGAQEQVTLALNGEAIATKPAVITAVHGVFTATFTAPSSILEGTNTISALGAQSRVAAVASFNGQLPQAAQFYFAGAINTTREHSYLDLLNTNRQPARVGLTFYFADGATYERTVAVGARSMAHISVASLNFLPEGTYGLKVTADRTIAAQIVTERPGQDGDVLLGVSGLSTHWYLAAGATTATFREQLSMLNPSTYAASAVLLHLVTPGGSSKTLLVSVPAHTNRVVDLNAETQASELSIIASAANPVVLERTLTFGPEGRGLTMRDAAATPATSWLFADATTENNVQTIFSVLNPSDQPALVTATFSHARGVVLGSKTLSVAAYSRATLNLADVVQGGGIAAVLTSNVGVVVERSEYIGTPDQATAGSDVVGRNGAAVRWIFPGGETTPGLDEVLDLYNPSAVAVPLTATFYAPDGHVASHRYTLAPTERLIIPVNALGLPEVHGAVLQAGTAQGFIAEQGISVRDSHLLRSTQGLAE